METEKSRVFVFRCMKSVISSCLDFHCQIWRGRRHFQPNWVDNKLKEIGRIQNRTIVSIQQTFEFETVDEKKNGEWRAKQLLHDILTHSPLYTHRHTYSYTITLCDVYFIHQISILSLDNSQCWATFEVCHQHNPSFFIREIYICIMHTNKSHSIN